MDELLNWCKPFGGSPGFTVTVKYDSASDKYVYEGGMYSDVIDYMIISNTEIKFFMKKGISAAKLSGGGQLGINKYLREIQKQPDGSDCNIWAYEFEECGQTDSATENGQSVLIHKFGQTFAKGKIKDIHFECGKVD